MNNKGFTLVEVIAVIAVLSLIIIIAVPTYNITSKNVKEKNVENKIKNIELAAQKYASDNNIEQNMSFSATKLILDNYLGAEEYKGVDPWIINPNDSNDNLACRIVEIAIEDYDYKVNVTNNSDCELSKNEIAGNRIKVRAFKYTDGSSGNIILGDELNVTNDIVNWSNSNVVLAVTTTDNELKQYKSISYSLLGDSKTKTKNNNELTTFTKGNSVNVDNYVNLYKIEASLLLKQSVYITMSTDSVSVDKSVLVQIDKEKPIFVEDSETESFNKNREASMYISDGTGSGINKNKVFYINSKLYSGQSIDSLNKITKFNDNKAIIQNIKKNGTFYVYAYDQAGNVSDRFEITTKGITTFKYYLELKGNLDGTNKDSLSGFGSASVYINGSRVKNAISTYREQYEYDDVNPVSYKFVPSSETGYSYDGITSNSAAINGTISDSYLTSTASDGNSGTIIVRLKYSTDYSTLYYDNQGGSGCTSKKARYGSTWGTLCEPYKDGYEFQGWYTFTDCYGNQITQSSVVDGNRQVFAYWKKDKIKVEIYVNHLRCADAHYDPNMFLGGYFTCNVVALNVNTYNDDVFALKPRFVKNENYKAKYVVDNVTPNAVSTFDSYIRGRIWDYGTDRSDCYATLDYIRCTNADVYAYDHYCAYDGWSSDGSCWYTDFYRLKTYDKDVVCTINYTGTNNPNSPYINYTCDQYAEYYNDNGICESCD